MLTADQLDSLTDPIVALYSEYEQSVINDIARRLSKMGMSSASAWQIQRLIESGGVYKNAIAQIAKLTGQSEKDLRAMFEKAGVKSMKFDDSIYKAAGLNPLPLNMSPAMAQVLAAGLRKTQGILSNLTLTTAMSGQQAFIKAADMAYLQVSTGAMSYDQAIQYAVKQMADGGLKVINYASGHVDKIDVATRRAVLTGVSQTTGNLQMARADQMGVDLVQTSAHGGARPSHQLWQGKIFSRSGTNKKYPDFVTETGYGTGPGLMGWNCRHSFFPFFEGISENAYNQATLDDYASTTVKLNGQDVPMYDATQYQRGIERKIRYWKRQADALGSAGQDNTKELEKVRQWQNHARAFVKETGLYRQPARERAIGFKKNMTVSQVSNFSAIRKESRKPISERFFELPNEKNINSRIQYALNVVDKVIKIPEDALPVIPIKLSDMGYPYGYFDSDHGVPKEIVISIKSDHLELTTLHELGHFIDLSGIGDKRIFSSEFNEISDWRDLVRDSHAFRKLKDLKRFGNVEMDGNIYSVDIGYVDYLLSNDELFSRSFAQYISVRSHDTILLKQIDQEMKKDIYGARQWPNADFESIAQWFDDYFKFIGWIP